MSLAEVNSKPQYATMVVNKTITAYLISCLVTHNNSNNTHEKITRFWLAESSAVQV